MKVGSELAFLSTFEEEVVEEEGEEEEEEPLLKQDMLMMAPLEQPGTGLP